jgi:Response regulators consisting of a CheY-like receiver domain and a winged-helix DNA-binding domain
VIIIKILIVEDEFSIQKALTKGFKKLGYATDSAIDGEEALELYYSNFYDLIILDLNLPKVDGIDVLKEIRKDNHDTPVLILSARCEVEDKIKGLDMGANDYLAKPFHFAELDARVRALLRRTFKTCDVVIECGTVKINTALKKAYQCGQETSLTKKEYGILEYLLLKKGKVVGAVELFEHIWDSEADVFSNSLKVHINSLRKKLPDDFIKTNKGQGYYVE